MHPKWGKYHPFLLRELVISMCFLSQSFMSTCTQEPGMQASVEGLAAAKLCSSAAKASAHSAI